MSFQDFFYQQSFLSPLSTKQTTTTAEPMYESKELCVVPFQDWDGAKITVREKRLVLPISHLENSNLRTQTGICKCLKVVSFFQWK